MRPRSAPVPSSAARQQPRTHASTGTGTGNSAGAILSVAGIHRAADASVLELERHMRRYISPSILLPVLSPCSRQPIPYFHFSNTDPDTDTDTGIGLNPVGEVVP